MKPRRTLSPQAAISRAKVSFRERGVHTVWYDLSITRRASEEYGKIFLHLNLTIMSYCAGTALITLRFWAEASVGGEGYRFRINIWFEGIRLISWWMNQEKMNDYETDNGTISRIKACVSKCACASVLTASSLTACQWPAGVDIIGLKNNSITLRQRLFQEQTDAQMQQPWVLTTILWRVMWGFGSEGFLWRLSKCPFDLVPGLDGGNTSNTDIERWTKKEDRTNETGRGREWLCH